MCDTEYMGLNVSNHADELGGEGQPQNGQRGRPRCEQASGDPVQDESVPGKRQNAAVDGTASPQSAVRVVAAHHGEWTRVGHWTAGPVVLLHAVLVGMVAVIATGGDPEGRPTRPTTAQPTTQPA